ncbi:hypothetical protein, conserved [Eimeria necatrix]|uniref:Uncharacterized protein n=1 Tax=Eimeria necatrix TaxID=51315 RepID=U6MRX9_9EIME|nr:hypothetical protein, conserved [Eimeria necatrix]CDJ66967.1 hypothetical protein, conserved [Eimeria necatrix]
MLAFRARSGFCSRSNITVRKQQCTLPGVNYQRSISSSVPVPWDTQQQLQQQQHQQQQQPLRRSDHRIPSVSTESVESAVGQFITACQRFQRQQLQQQWQQQLQHQVGAAAGTPSSLTIIKETLSIAPAACMNAALQAMQQELLPLSLVVPLAEAFYAAAEKQIEQQAQQQLSFDQGYQQEQQSREQKQNNEDNRAAEMLLDMALLLEPNTFIVGGRQQQCQIKQQLLLLPQQAQKKRQLALQTAVLVLRPLLQQQPLLLRDSQLAKALLKASDESLQQLLQQTTAQRLKSYKETQNNGCSSSSSSAQVALTAALLRSCAAFPPSEEVYDAAADFLLHAAAAAKHPLNSEPSLKVQQGHLAAWCDVAAALCLKQQQQQVFWRLLPSVESAVYTALSKLLQHQQHENKEHSLVASIDQLEPAAAALSLLRERRVCLINADTRTGAATAKSETDASSDLAAEEAAKPAAELFPSSTVGLEQQKQQQEAHQLDDGKTPAATAMLQQTFFEIWHEVQAQQQRQQHETHSENPECELPRPAPSSPFNFRSKAANDAAEAGLKPAAGAASPGRAAGSEVRRTTDSEAALLRLLHQLLLLAGVQGQQQLSKFLQRVVREVLPACDLQQLVLLLQHVVRLVEMPYMQGQQQRLQPAVNLGMFVDAVLLAVDQRIKRHQHCNASLSSNSRLSTLASLADALCSSSLKKQLQLPSAAFAAVKALLDDLLLEIQLAQRQQQQNLDQRVALQEAIVYTTFRAVSATLSLDESNASSEAKTRPGASASATDAAAATMNSFNCYPELLRVLGETILMLQGTAQAIVSGSAAPASEVNYSQQQACPQEDAPAIVKRHSDSLVLAVAILARCLQDPALSNQQARWGFYALLASLYESSTAFFIRRSGEKTTANAVAALSAEQVLVLLQCHLFLLEASKQQLRLTNAARAVASSVCGSTPQAATAAAEAAKAATSSPEAQQLLIDIYRGLRSCSLKTESLKVVGGAMQLFSKIQTLTSHGPVDVASAAAAQQQQQQPTGFTERIVGWFRSRYTR